MARTKRKSNEQEGRRASKRTKTKSTRRDQDESQEERGSADDAIAIEENNSNNVDTNSMNSGNEPRGGQVQDQDDLTMPNLERQMIISHVLTPISWSMNATSGAIQGIRPALSMLTQNIHPISSDISSAGQFISPISSVSHNPYVLPSINHRQPPPTGQATSCTYSTTSLSSATRVIPSVKNIAQTIPSVSVTQTLPSQQGYLNMNGSNFQHNVAGLQQQYGLRAGVQHGHGANSNNGINFPLNVPGLQQQYGTGGQHGGNFSTNVPSYRQPIQHQGNIFQAVDCTENVAFPNFINPNSTLQSVPVSGSNGICVNEGLIMPSLDCCFASDIDSHVKSSVREKIAKSIYIDLGYLLEKNLLEIDPFATETQLNFDPKSGKITFRPKESRVKITDLDQWTNAFIIFIYIYLKTHPGKNFELLSYLNVIRMCAIKYTFARAYKYDIQYRLRKAVNPTSSWANINYELFLFCMTAPLDPSDLQIPDHAKAVPSTHTNQAHVNQVPKTSLQQDNTTSLSPVWQFAKANNFRSPSHTQNKPACNRWNKFGVCSFGKFCKFNHVCEKCNERSHPAIRCKKSL